MKRPAKDSKRQGQPQKKKPSLSHFIEAELLPRLKIDKLFSSLGPHFDGFHWRMKCPECGFRTLILPTGDKNLSCPKEVGCGYRVGVLEFLVRPKPLRGTSLTDLIESLCDDLGILSPRDRTKADRLQSLKEKALKKYTKPTMESVAEFLARGGQIGNKKSPHPKA